MEDEEGEEARFCLAKFLESAQSFNSTNKNSVFLKQYFLCVRLAEISMELLRKPKHTPPTQDSQTV